MKKTVLALLMFSSLTSKATTYSTQDYIEMWQNTAIEQMIQYKIPASITLAQGILESANGNSKLAREAKNHFGIKCHKNWTGDTFFQDDDKKNECFRAYNSANESYRDHSLFLAKRKRYASLFDLSLTDYKGWAKGLKAAGYATNPKYAHLLINIIEKYDLSRFDEMSENYYKQKERDKENQLSSKPKISEKREIKVNHSSKNTSTHEITYEIGMNEHKIYKNHNGVKYVLVKKGDTFYRLSKEFNLAIGQLYKYNEFNKKDVLKEGDVVYITPKKGRAKKGNNIYTCKTDVTLREIAHFEGVKLNKLLKLNLMENPDRTLPKGTKVILR
ncbi:MAG TPA: LysM peptidoglycan-binding domain-containing protein [Crocinitomix sp.]|nr:LysM peptidoglycan-binding domain-containing protein [Crocinitomix sp.]